MQRAEANRLPEYIKTRCRWQIWRAAGVDEPDFRSCETRTLPKYLLKFRQACRKSSWVHFLEIIGKAYFVTQPDKQTINRVGLESPVAGKPLLVKFTLPAAHGLRSEEKSIRDLFRRNLHRAGAVVFQGPHLRQRMVRQWVVAQVGIHCEGHQGHEGDDRQGEIQAHDPLHPLCPSQFKLSHCPCSLRIASAQETVRAELFPVRLEEQAQRGRFRSSLRLIRH